MRNSELVIAFWAPLIEYMLLRSQSYLHQQSALLTNTERGVENGTSLKDPNTLAQSYSSAPPL